MTTYKLNDTLDELLNREMTGQLLLILGDSDEKDLTRTQIKERGEDRWGKKFKTDKKGERILRYLKTMDEYGLVKENPQGQGKSSLWMKLETSKEIDFQVALFNSFMVFHSGFSS